MKLRLSAAARAAALLSPLTACTTDDAPLVCSGIPEVTPRTNVAPTNGKWGVKDNLEVTLDVVCPSTVCLTLDGSEPTPGRASTMCYPAPIKQIPIARSTCIKYFVISPDGSQGAVHSQCYQVEQAPEVSCNPPSRTSNQDINVVLSSDKSNTTIYYTTDGTDPDPDDASTPKGEAPVTVQITRSGTLKFRGTDDAGNVGKTRSCSYQVDKLPPVTTASPLPDNGQSSPLTVLLSASEAATIYYTTDGSEPKPERSEPNGSTQYGFLQTEVRLDQSSYLRFYANDSAGNDEVEKQELVYILNGKPAVKMEPGAGFYTEDFVEISFDAVAADGGTPADGGVTIYYTLDGTDPRTSGTRQTYTAGTLVTDFQEPGEWTLKYYAVDDTMVEGAVQTAVFTLGVSTPPFYRVVNFNSTQYYDAAQSSRTIEWDAANSRLRTRRKMPTLEEAVHLTDNQNFQPNPAVSVSIAPSTSGAHLYYGSSFQTRLYSYDGNLARTQLDTECYPKTGVFCTGAGPTAQIMAVRAYQQSLAEGSRGLVAFAAGGNEGIFRNAENTLSTVDYTSNFDLFAAPQNMFDDADDLVRPSKVDIAVGGDTFYSGAWNGTAHTVYGFNTTNGVRSITGSAVLGGRALSLALDQSIAPTRLAVGEEGGRLAILDPDDLSEVSSAAVDCGGASCRINDVTWLGTTQVLLAVGFYDSPSTGGIYVADVDIAGNIANLRAGLNGDDAYLINSPLKSLVMLDTIDDLAVAAAERDGVFLIDTTDVDNLNPLGYLNAADIDDDIFTPVDIASFRDGGVPLNRFAVADGGRTATQTDAGFIVAEAPDDPRLYEESGVIVTNDLNGGEKRIKRMRITDYNGNNNLPAGVSVSIVTDEGETFENVVRGQDVVFDDPPLEVRAHIEFDNAGGASEVKLSELIRFQLYPVE